MGPVVVCRDVARNVFTNGTGARNVFTNGTGACSGPTTGDAMNFVKMHGCGNDFIVTHEIADGAVENLRKRAPLLCDRRRGIGADGIILVLPSIGAGLKMRIINADGSEAEMCGNGIRCFAIYVRDKGLNAGGILTVDTLAGKIVTTLRGDTVRVDMGPPVLEASRIPVAGGSGPVIMQPVVADGRRFSVTAVSMGNPHAVIYADELTDDLVHNWGRRLECHPFFPRRVNVEFVKVVSDSEVRMRVFERGVGETHACGTGACATVVAGILNKKHGNAVKVRLIGGDLNVEWSGDPSQPVYMSGPAAVAYEGSIPDVG